ncbi:peptide chain release factor N(5)-glutamine methyltransferase [Phaeocystidibacter luteus]|uniref:peptide chain release factor N(5)-glutamine methyltransferase n=1 Tax=Phaeocystidibacter luteus TaxID=911197 RepID=A0A6N6RLN9_9FLAO|nr:peptide chain release factor N(5)-glutamine methyltransferase [Phaeocystidibacter luteus]KAB2814482.1 peptide chain release factor N(5)-glutamine methyltransferase [Phaeocystidibacter luteus]
MTGRELQMFWNDSLSSVYEPSEAQQLLRMWLEDVHEVSRMEWISSADREVHFDVENVLERLQKGEPIQHIIGFAYFMDMKFQVNSDVLIPRPETEDLVRWLVDHLPEGSRVLDIGTGSGCIAITLKKYRPDLELTALDVSVDALKVARNNAKELAVEVRFIEHDILSGLPPGDWDAIVSNPPYIEEKERPGMSKNVVDFDPNLALFVPDGRPELFYEEISKVAASMPSRPWLAFECHINHTQKVAQIMRDYGWKGLEILDDITERPRFVIGRS